MLREQGETDVEVAQITGNTRSYVSTMLKRLGGAPGMLEGMPRGGRPPGSLRAMSMTEERRAQQLICGKCPDQLSLPFALWTRAAIRELIRRELGIRLSIRGVGEYVARWGYTPQKAARRTCERGIPPKDAKELMRTILSHSRRIQKSPARVRAYLRNRDTRYAA